MNDFTVHVQDLYLVGYCHSGTRTYFKITGLDWNDFLNNGVSAQKLLAMNDALATKLVEAVKLARGI